MKLIGLDIGDRRIGVAFGDSSLRLATPVNVITRVSLEQDAQAVLHYVREYDARWVVVGLPRNMDGSMGPQAEATHAYAEKLAAVVQAPFKFWDERLTTVEAASRTQESGGPPRTPRRGKKARQTLDAIAASVILQDFMDAQANEIQAQEQEQDVA